MVIGSFASLAPLAPHSSSEPVEAKARNEYMASRRDTAAVAFWKKVDCRSL